MLLYIHGFNSGIASPKAQRWQSFFHQYDQNASLMMPQLPACPKASIALLEKHVKTALDQGEQLGYIGSSLGGYYATYLREKFGGRAILMNPAAKAYQVMLNFVGWHKNPYTGESAEVKVEHAELLKQYEPPALKQPEHYLVFLETGDKVLDYRTAQALYQDSHLEVIPGGSHSFESFERFLPKMGAFFRNNRT